MADISSITLPGGGTYDLKDKNAVPKYGMGKNLLDNWYFLNPVNQRGLTTYSGAVRGIDRWICRAATGTVTLSSSGVTVSKGGGTSVDFYQPFSTDMLAFLQDRKLTVSILLDSNAFASATFTWGSSWATALTASNFIIMAGGSTQGFTNFCIRFSADRTVVAVKLELGTEQTLAHLEGSTWVLNEIPDYEYELYRCMTSTADSTDTYANKSLATEQQIAYVESGTTASRDHAVGEYFCWNGLLYRATTAISSGGTFTPGTNCEQVTVGAALFGQMRRDTLYNPGGSVSVATDITITLLDDYRNYKFVQMILYNSATSSNTTRAIVTIPTNNLESRVHYPLAFGSTVGSVSIGVGSTVGTTIRFYASAISPLTIRYIFGLA